MDNNSKPEEIKSFEDVNYSAPRISFCVGAGIEESFPYIDLRRIRRDDTLRVITLFFGEARVTINLKRGFPVKEQADLLLNLNRHQVERVMPGNLVDNIYVELEEAGVDTLNPDLELEA
jgi:hypothetical protein